MVFSGDVGHVLLAAVDLFHVHRARALAAVNILAADLRERVLLVREHDRVASRKRAEAEPVGADIGTGVLDEPDEFTVVHLGADERDARAVCPLLRLAAAYFLERLFQFVDQQVLRRDIGRERQHVEFVTRDARPGLLAEVAERADERAYAVVLGHRPADGGVGHVRAEGVVQGLEDVVFALEHEQVHAVVVGLERDLHVLVEEMVLAGTHGLEQFHVFHAAVDHRTAVGRDDAVGKVEAALDRALEQGAAGLAQEARHVIGRNVHRPGVRGVQAHAEGVVQIHQGLGCVLADKGDAFFAFRLGLDNKCVVGLLQEVLEVGQVLQVSHCCIPPILVTRYSVFVRSMPIAML